MNDTVFHYVVWHCSVGNCDFKTDSLYRMKEHLIREHEETPIPVSFRGETIPIIPSIKKKGSI